MELMEIFTLVVIYNNYINDKLENISMDIT